MAQIEIFGWSTDQRFDDWREKFTQDYDNDDQTLFVSNETFHHNEDDGFDFDYKMCVQFVDLRQYTDADFISYQLLMVVLPKSLHKSHIERLLADYGNIATPDEIDLRDVIDTLSASVKFAEGKCTEWSEIDDVMLSIAHVFEGMNNLRGFYIDKYWNRIGSTGWDILEHATKGTDLFQPAFDRYKEEMKEAV